MRMTKIIEYEKSFMEVFMKLSYIQNYNVIEFHIHLIFAFHINKFDCLIQFKKLSIFFLLIERSHNKNKGNMREIMLFM